jgi:hypothetical protein
MGGLVISSEGTRTGRDYSIKNQKGVYRHCAPHLEYPGFPLNLMDRSVAEIHEIQGGNSWVFWGSR